MKKILWSCAAVLILLFATWSGYARQDADGEPRANIEAASQLASAPLASFPETSTGSSSAPRTPAESGPELSPPYEVARVVDGDTIDVMMDGKVERLRLIGINTPETVDPRKPVECFGREASARASELLAGKQVRLESDPSQGERDRYGRLLRYVFLEDGTSFNLAMIRGGYAYEYTLTADTNTRTNSRRRKNTPNQICQAFGNRTAKARPPSCRQTPRQTPAISKAISMRARRKSTTSPAAARTTRQS